MAAEEPTVVPAEEVAPVVPEVLAVDNTDASENVTAVLAGVADTEEQKEDAPATEAAEEEQDEEEDEG